MGIQSGIRQAYSASTDARQAAQELHASVAQPGMELVLFFCSNDYDLDALAAELNHLFAGVQLVGCTTAGEIGPGGYQVRGLAGVSFSSGTCTAVSGYVDHLQNFQIAESYAHGLRLLQELERKAPQTNARNTFGLLLIDGLSLREEVVIRVFQEALGKVPLVGGSAGDGLNFGKTYVFVDGSFRSDCAVLTLVSTPLPFTVFKTQHFVATDQRLVITEADAAQRVVREINGLPAAQEYARLLGVDVHELSPNRFAAWPMVVLIDGNNYVRAVREINSDESIAFYCAIEEGVVLRVARGVDLIENLEEAFAKIRAQIGPPQLVIACDCILRRMEIVQNHLEERVGQILKSNNTVGFNTYGEQFQGVHINQTITGIAIGMSSTEVHGG
jgi:hypothetical protein